MFTVVHNFSHQYDLPLTELKAPQNEVHGIELFDVAL